MAVTTLRLSIPRLAYALGQQHLHSVRPPFTRAASTSTQLADGDLRPLKPRFDLTGKTVVLTGAGRGITYAAARAVAEYGGNVAVLDVLPNPVDDFQNLSKEFGVKTTYIHADVTSEPSLTKAFDQVVDEFGSIHGCVPGAGIAIDKPFVDHSWQEFKRLMDINLAGTYFSAQLATKQMLAQGTGGSIVFVSSVSADVHVPGHNLPAYAATKAGVRMLSKALAFELAPHGVRTNSISPGYIESAMTRQLRVQYPHLVEIMQNAPPMKRIGNRNDLTGAIVYLLSDAASYTTGTDIQVTGGLHAGRSEI